MTKLGGSDLERFMRNVEGPSLDDPRNHFLLEQLARSFSAPVPIHNAAGVPLAFGQLLFHIRELVVRASWIDFVHRGLRACIITNSGDGRGFKPFRITPCQVVAVLLPNATVAHPLELVRLPGVGMALYYPHASIACQLRLPMVEQSADRMWTLGGNPLPPLQLPFGYYFAGCLDGVLYAINHCPSFHPPSAMATLEALAALGATRWQAPSPQACAQAAQARAAAATQAINRNTIGAVLTLVVLILIPCVMGLLRRLFE